MADMASILAAISDKRAGTPRVEWYEAGATGWARCVVSLESGLWTLERRIDGELTATNGVLDGDLVEGLRDLAAQVQPEDDPGGPDLSASGLQTLRVVVDGAVVDVRGGESEWFPERPERLVRHLVRVIPGFPGYNRP